MRTTVKIYLWLMLLMSLVFGLLYLFVPEKMIEPLGYGALGTAALADIKTTFAAFQLAMAAFLWWCLRMQQERIGLVCMFFAALAFVLCRGYGLYVDGDRTPMLVGTIAFEASLSLISLVLYLLYTAAQTNDDATPAVKMVLGALALATLGSGVYSALMPMQALTPMGFDQLSPAALTDARGSYGGFQMGLALFMLWCLKTRHIYAGALNFLLCIGLVVLCRAFVMVLDNVFTQGFIGALIFEAVLAAIGLWMVRQAGAGYRIQMA